ncbi:uncharacterized protein VICG_00037 [Vittaforma corneae ATCC 50505]|uniref:Uncharacterized protein n=1 Tax=Vittaforma corneae (strain ATCC 50505) TaxID=993615 RepID=L2GQY0_VITCO|nr:uncharacterized protein VICG_00037 [Vittaforma corneae ATCC 50505]ELA42722.1 hypothetical protein VICG_00037 [Vittaforma corneae ATCC 50505]
MIIVYIAVVLCQFRIIHNNQTMNDFNFLCNPKYGEVTENMSLERLIVFARNGDRSPEQGRNKGWSKRICIKCRRTRCFLVHCEHGMLTVKGYKQGHDLAGFIKKEYYPRFSYKNISYVRRRKHPFHDYIQKRTFNNTDYNQIINNVNMGENIDGSDMKSAVSNNVDSSTGSIFADVKIQGYFYKNNRNYVFLRSITEALEYSSLTLHPVSNLGCKKECLDVRNSLFSKNDTKELISGGEFDRIIGSLCNEVPIECSRFDCDLMKMEDYMTQMRMNFEDNLAKMKEDITSTAVDFGELSQFILSILTNNDISIVSVTGETLVTLLAGLNTKNSKLVPYASAVFIELWKDKKGKEFYGVKYNGKRMKIGLFKEDFVEKDQFVKFLKMFAKHNSRIAEICKINIKSMNKDELLSLKRERVRKMLDPLIKKLHERRLLMK